MHKRSDDERERELKSERRARVVLSKKQGAKLSESEVQVLYIAHFLHPEFFLVIENTHAQCAHVDGQSLKRHIPRCWIVLTKLLDVI